MLRLDLFSIPELSEVFYILVLTCLAQIRDNCNKKSTKSSINLPLIGKAANKWSKRLIRW